MSNRTPRITPVTMVIFGVGWFGLQAFWAFEAAAIPLFLRAFTESKFTISLVTSLAGVTGFFVPPMVGYLSDRTSPRFGRRKPYYLLGVLGVLACLISLSGASAFGVAALLSGIMYFCLRLAETPYLSLLPDITPTEQRGTASGVMNLCGSIGLVSCFAVTSAIWGSNPTAVFFLVGFVCLASMLITVTFVREPSEVPEASARALGPSDYLRSLTEEKNVLVYLTGQTCWWLGFYMVSSFATLFVTEELGAPEARSFLVLMVFAIVAALFMLPLGMLGDRYGRKGILSWMVGLWAAAQLIVGLSQNLTHALLTVGLSAIPFAGIMAVGYAFFLDLIPRKRTAEFVGISVVSIAVAVILGRLTGGKLIDVFGYRSIFPTAAAIMMVGLAILQAVRPRSETKHGPQDALEA